MDVVQNNTIGGSLQISADVIAKIATMATMEIEGIAEVSAGSVGVKGLFNKVLVPKAVLVNLVDDVAELTVSVVVKYGYKIQPLCVKIQENVKNAVQSMSSITVSKVNVCITGVTQETSEN